LQLNSGSELNKRCTIIIL